MKKYFIKLIVIFSIIPILYCNEENNNQINFQSILNKILLKNNIKERLELINKEMNDNYENDLFKNMGYKFHLLADLNENKIKEIYISARNKNKKTCYLFIIENEKNPKLLKYFEFERSKLCLKFINETNPYILVVFELESEDNGDLLYQSGKFIFKPFVADY